MGACTGERLPRLVPVLIAILALPFGACFRRPDVGKMNCVVEKGCPSGYVCIVSGSTGRCERPSDGGDTARLPGPDATASDAPGDTAVGRDAVDADGGTIIDSSNVADRMGIDATAADLPIMDPDVPLIADGGLGTGGAGGGGMGGASGTGGSTTVDAPGAGGVSGTGGVASSGGAPGTGGIVSSGGAPGTGGIVSSGGTPGTGGMVSSGGTPGTGGVVSSGGTPGTGGSVSSGGTPGTGGVVSSGGTPSGCVGNALPTADPTVAGPFQVVADKDVGPLAGVVPDPIYGDQQKRFNVYRPANLASSGYCHPILIWANHFADNPEPNPPLCVVDPPNRKYCGQYLPLMNHLASHGFVVVAALSTSPMSGSPLPAITGLDWIVEQSEFPPSPYYHRLDTANIGQLGHRAGGAATCMSAAEPRYKALSTISGVKPLTGVHTPMMFFCGGNDLSTPCSDVRSVFLTVTDQPAFFMNDLNLVADDWVDDDPSVPALTSAAAWFRVHLMGDTANRKYFYGSNCTFCTDTRVAVEQNALMAQ